MSIALVACVVGSVSPARAQDPYSIYAPVKSLATLFTDIYGSHGLIVDSTATLPGEQVHSAHFNSAFQFDFGQFSTALVNQLVNVPLPSPASGFTYRFDPSLGVFERSTQSFGPILAERADTVGSGRVSFGAAYQRFTFDTVEGLDLHRVPAVFTHDNAALRGGREDIVTTINSIDVTVGQFTSFLTVGIGDRFDLSLAVPVVTNDLRVVSNATVRRLGTTNPLTHFFRQSDGEVGVDRIFWAAGRASGLGDVTVRMKTAISRNPSSGFAIGADVRLPTGDELNLLGSGTTTVRPFAIWSATLARVSPHLNAGYAWSGSSVLAGNPATGELADFPEQATYAGGIDVSVNRYLTVALDVIGRYQFETKRLVQEEFRALDAAGSTFANVGFVTDTFNALSGAFGLKANVVERLLLDVNLLFKLDEHGLRDKVTPLVGLEYAF
jgi:hypothetical protein